MRVQLYIEDKSKTPKSKTTGHFLARALIVPELYAFTTHLKPIQLNVVVSMVQFGSVLN